VTFSISRTTARFYVRSPKIQLGAIFSMRRIWSRGKKYHKFALILQVVSSFLKTLTVNFTKTMNFV
jgi:hypothetical protein